MMNIVYFYHFSEEKSQILETHFDPASDSRLHVNVCIYIYTHCCKGSSNWSGWNLFDSFRPKNFGIYVVGILHIMHLWQGLKKNLCKRWWCWFGHGKIWRGIFCVEVESLIMLLELINYLIIFVSLLNVWMNKHYIICIIKQHSLHFPSTSLSIPIISL